MADTFALDLSKFIAKAQNSAREVVQKTCSQAFGRVVEMTPVGDPTKWKSKPPPGYVGGRLRANWNPSIGTPDLSTTFTVDPSGGATEARIRAKLGEWTDGDIYLMNSLPYVREIEYEGHSSQAPAGMVRITVADFQTFITNAVAGLPK